jgi:hypothetical protein
MHCTNATDAALSEEEIIDRWPSGGESLTTKLLY